METRTIVVDVDDTILTHVNRDYVNALPHAEIISKLNSMRRAGWRIVYFTARGQLSCDGDLELIESRNRDVLESWMATHGVEYDELRFGKPLAAYYVDDKAIRPNELLDSSFETIVGGSGAVVDFVGDRVIKKAKNAVEQAEWYRLARQFCSVPEVYSSHGDMIIMERVNGHQLSDVVSLSDVPTLLQQLNIFSVTKPPLLYPWVTYVDRVGGHLSKGVPMADEVMRIVDDPRVHAGMNVSSSFCHGDMTLENIIKTDEGRLVYIDPNCPPGVFTSWLLDVGKLLQSLRFGYERQFKSGQDYPPELIDRLLETLTPRQRHLAMVAELTHYVRMYWYKSERERSLVSENMRRLMEMMDVP